MYATLTTEKTFRYAERFKSNSLPNIVNQIHTTKVLVHFGIKSIEGTLHGKWLYKQTESLVMTRIKLYFLMQNSVLYTYLKCHLSAHYAHHQSHHPPIIYFRAKNPDQ